MKRPALFILVMLVAVCGSLVMADTVSAQTYPLLQQDPVPVLLTGGNLQNTRGWRFSVNEPGGICVTELCQRTPVGGSGPGPNRNQTLVLWDWSGQSIISSAASDPNVPVSGANGWRCYDIADVHLADGSINLMAVNTSPAPSTNSYFWHNNTPASWRPTGTVQYLDMRFNNFQAATVFPTSVLGNLQYGVPDFGYTVGACGGAPPGGSCDLSQIESKLDDEVRFTDDDEFDAAHLAISASFTAITAQLNSIEAKIDALDLSGIEAQLCEVTHLLMTPQGLRCTDTVLCGPGEWGDGLEGRETPARCDKNDPDPPQLSSVSGGGPSFIGKTLEGESVPPLMVIPAENGGLLDRVANVVNIAVQFHRELPASSGLAQAEAELSQAEWSLERGDYRAAYDSYRRAYRALIADAE